MYFEFALYCILYCFVALLLMRIIEHFIEPTYDYEYNHWLNYEHTDNDTLELDYLMALPEEEYKKELELILTARDQEMEQNEELAYFEMAQYERKDQRQYKDTVYYSSHTQTGHRGKQGLKRWDRS